MDNLPINWTQLEYHVGGYYFSHNEELFHECPRLWEDVQNFSLARHRSSKPSSLLGSFARFLISFFRTEFMPREFLWGDWIQAVTWIGPPTCKTQLFIHLHEKECLLCVQLVVVITVNRF